MVPASRTRPASFERGERAGHGGLGQAGVPRELGPGRGAPGAQPVEQQPLVGTALPLRVPGQVATLVAAGHRIILTHRSELFTDDPLTVKVKVLNLSTPNAEANPCTGESAAKLPLPRHQPREDPSVRNPSAGRRFRPPDRPLPGHRHQHEPDVRHRPLRDHPADGRRVRRAAGRHRLRRRRDTRAGRRADLGRTRRLAARIRRQLRLSAPGLPVPHGPADAVPLRVDGDALHPADHVHRRRRLRPVPRLPRPGPRARPPAT